MGGGMDMFGGGTYSSAKRMAISLLEESLAVLNAMTSWTCPSSKLPLDVKTRAGTSKCWVGHFPPPSGVESPNFV